MPSVDISLSRYFSMRTEKSLWRRSTSDAHDFMLSVCVWPFSIRLSDNWSSSATFSRCSFMFTKTYTSSSYWQAHRDYYTLASICWWQSSLPAQLTTQQGVDLTGRNTTGRPSRAAPGELRCICDAMECYRQRTKQYTMCRRASNK